LGLANPYTPGSCIQKTARLDRNQSGARFLAYEKVSPQVRRVTMTATKVPVTTSKQPTEPATAAQPWQPFETLRREVDRLFDDFGSDFWRRPFRAISDFEPFSRKFALSPAVDIAESDKAYEITAELPGMDEKNIEVKVVNGALTIKGEKKDEKEEKTEDRYLSERRYGSFERYFQLPEGVDEAKIEASFKKGILTVTLPKKPEAQQPAKKIDVKAA
jgi:HSP20 family protein